MYGIWDGTKVIAKFTAPLSVSSNVPVFVSDALSLKRLVSKRPTQRWEISATVEPLSFGSNDLFAMLVKSGHFGEIQILMPQNYGAVVARTTVGPGTASGSAGATSVSASSGGFIPKGTFIKFASHSKIYLSTADLAGSGSLQIVPELRASVSGTMYHGDDVVGSFLLDPEVIAGMSYRDGILQDLGTLKFVERL
jgi:hypothetical protein